MSDTADRIAKILEDPESIKMISEIAESFIGGGMTEGQTQGEQEKNIIPLEKDDGEGQTNNPLASISEIVEKLVSGADIENTLRLISAIEPYLSKRRQSGARSVKKTLGLIRTLGNGSISDITKLMSAINKQ